MDLVKHRSNSLFYSARTRARKKGLEFSLTKDWIYDKITKGKCEITSFTLVLTPISNTRKKKSNPYAPSLDRINSNLGYTPDNTQIVLNVVNKFKSDMIQYEMIDIAKAIANQHMSKRQFIIS